MHHPENIERQEEMESCSDKIKLKRHFMVDFRLIKDIGDNFSAITIAERLRTTNSKTVIPSQFKELEPAVAISTAGCIRSWRKRVLHCH